MGIEFFQTRMGQRFYEGTMPALVKVLERIAASLEPAPDDIIPYVVHKPRSPDALWADDKVQFARLLVELGAACEMPELAQVEASMGLDAAQLYEIWERAGAVWEQSKADNCPPHKKEGA